MKVYKYMLKPRGPQDLVLPIGARFLAVGAQGDALAAWFGVDPEAPTVTRRLEVTWTGGEIPSRGFYLGTAQLADGTVCHVWEYA